MKICQKLKLFVDEISQICFFNKLYYNIYDLLYKRKQNFQQRSILMYPNIS